jgi:hypothetical protein
MSADVERLRNELYEWCGNSRACRRAVDYYIMLLQNPCYPPSVKITYKMRKYYVVIVRQYGLPPRCNIKKLVEERLRGTPLEKHVNEIAEIAELLKNEFSITSRVSAAVAAVVVAELNGIKMTRDSIAARFGTSYASMRAHIRDVYRIYNEIVARKI